MIIKNGFKFQYHVNICYIINSDGRILLQKKARGFGAGKWNGPGGKIEPGEGIEESVRREVAEETGLTVKDLEKIGELEFVFRDRPEWNNYMHAFVCREFAGEAEDKGEGRLKWCHPEELPYEKMWDDDPHWLPRALQGEFVNMRFHFDYDGNLIDFVDYNNV